MPSLDPNSWSQRDRDALDRHITGNWEGDIAGSAYEANYEPNDQDPTEPDMRLVYIRESGQMIIERVPIADYIIYDAYTGTELHRTSSRRDAIDYCNDRSWDVRDGPVEPEDDDSNDLGAWIDDDPFLTP